MPLKRRQEPLRSTDGAEALHRSFTLPGRLMGVLGPVGRLGSMVLGATAPVQQRLAEHGIRPAEHYLDSGYSSADLIAAAREQGTRMVTPALLDHSGPDSLVNESVHHVRGRSRALDRSESEAVVRSRGARGYCVRGCYFCPVVARQVRSLAWSLPVFR